MGKPLENGVLPSGKCLHNELERSTIFNGTTHYFDWSILNSYVKLPEGIWLLVRFNHLEK